MDINALSSGGDGRYPGFGIGQTLADITGMAGSQPTNGMADVYVAYDDIGTTRGIAVFHNGGLQGHTAFTASRPDTLSAKFTYNDFNAGSALNYEVFLDGMSIVSGSTTWNGNLYAQDWSMDGRIMKLVRVK